MKQIHESGNRIDDVRIDLHPVMVHSGADTGRMCISVRD